MKNILALVLAALLAVPSGWAKPRAARADVVGDFDYYLLSLSWSPVYCDKHPEDRQQCGSKRYGFVLHGLWPQHADGGHPDSCATPSHLTEEARAIGRTVFPSEKLIAHEWQKHGTCSGMAPKDYFKAADAARNAIRVPPQFEPGARTQETTAREVSKAIREANPRITNSGLAVVCSGPELAEVRICLSKDLQPVPCGSGVRDACRRGPIRVPGVR